MTAKKKMSQEKGAGASGNTRSLRDEAEKRLARSPKISPTLKGQTPEQLIHEIQVHQIEFELQAEELRRSKLSLEGARDKYLDLYEFAPVGYLTLTDKGIITNANLTGATLLGVERNNLIRAPFSKCIAEKDADTWHRYFVNILKQEEKQTCTLTLKRGDGSTFPARLESIRLPVSSDGAATVRVAISDMTEIWQAEEEITFKNVILSTQQETSLDGILAVDENGKILSYNRHFVELWGIPDDIIASGSDKQTLQSIIDKLANPDAFVARVTYLYTHKDEKSREEIELKDGRIFDRYSAPMFGLNKKYYGRVWYFRDITGHKQAENTLALTARKLTLMNDVTYQYIQNKVTAVRGYAELSKDVKTKAERLSFIEKEEHILADIHHLIKNTREYQEIGLLLPQWIPVERSVRIAVSLVSPKPGISIETALHGLELYTDPLIEKIFANLIENAVIHGKTTRRIRFSCEEKPDDLILICEDDGVGISPEIKDHLFERSVGENIRFGLFFVRECLLLSGMTIAETGEPGKGTRFEITVPKGAYRFTGADRKN